MLKWVRRIFGKKQAQQAEPLPFGGKPTCLVRGTRCPMTVVPLDSTRHPFVDSVEWVIEVVRQDGVLMGCLPKHAETLAKYADSFLIPAITYTSAGVFTHGDAISVGSKEVRKAMRG